MDHGAENVTGREIRKGVSDPDRVLEVLKPIQFREKNTKLQNASPFSEAVGKQVCPWPRRSGK